MWCFYCVVVHQHFQGHRKDCLWSVHTGCKVCAEGNRSKHIVQSIFFLAGSDPIVQGVSVCSPLGSSTSLDAAVRARLKGMMLTTVPLCQQLTFQSLRAGTLLGALCGSLTEAGAPFAVPILQICKLTTREIKKLAPSQC